MLQQIPTFYKRKDVVSPDSIGLQKDLQKAARSRLLSKKAAEVNISDEDFRTLLRRMCELSDPVDEYQTLDGKTITFDNYMALGRDEQIHPTLRKQMFKPSMFLMFPKTMEGHVYADVVFSCATEMREQRRIRLDLALIDKENTGHLTELQLASYFDRFMTDVPEEHIDFYLAVIVRKFVFFLEQNKRIAIRDLMASPILVEFRHRHSNPDSWFHPSNVYRLYDTFKDLDEDNNAFLSRSEMLNFSLDGASYFPRITPLVVDRLFDCRATRSQDNPNGELDFREFLGFVLAFQSRSNEVSLRYFWQLLDTGDQGYLTSADVREFVQSVFDTIGNETLMNTVGPVLVEDVLSEVFDMANAGKSPVITLDDLNQSGHGSIIIKFLTDPWGFIDYEQRETRLAQQQQQQEQQQQQYAGEEGVGHEPTEEELAESSNRIFDSSVAHAFEEHLDEMGSHSSSYGQQQQQQEETNVMHPAAEGDYV